MKQKFYFLFGSEACEYFLADGVEALVSKIKDDEFTNFETMVFNSGDEHPVNLLNAYNGWEDYAVISKEEYDKINTAYESINN